MEALARPGNEADHEPELILEWPALNAPAIRKQAWAGSLLVHAVVLGVLLVLPQAATMGPESGHIYRAGTRLVAPPAELTQTAPNRGKVGREFSLENLVPRPPLRVPPAIPPVSTRAGRPIQTAQVKQPALLPEPPRVDTAPSPPPAAAAPPGGSALPAPPQIQPEEKPKLAFETPGAPGPRKPTGLGGPQLSAPETSVLEATRSAMRGSRGAIAVGDVDIAGSSGIGGGFSQLPAPGKTATALEMTSDPMGVDFKPYLIQILAAVKRNWLAVIPESARLGRAGRVQIQFAIARDGNVPKLVIALPSGADALDRAAVAGVSASAPFPPLPSEFKGNQIRLQFTFSYNIR